MLGQTISHYKVVERLGGGGMGVVYKAEDLKLGRFVALKFLPPELGQDEKRRKRFVQEAKAASFLDHPNLCTIYEIDQTSDGQLFISMALYEGDTLKSKIETGTISRQSAVEIALQIAGGLAIAHQNGIIHRDIKPANVILTRSGLVKILDFGLAKLVGASQITEAETAVGTISYMSPEQALGKNVDQRTDIWSWGLVLYEMFAGQLPFRAETPVQILHSLFSLQPVELSHPFIPAEVRNVLKKALAKNPDERYDSIVQADQELRNVKLSSQSLSVTVPPINHAAEPTIPEFGLTLTPHRAEKKALTFVVCGIAGYTEMLEQLPFDEVNRFTSRVQQSTESLADRYHAILNEFDPDRIIVLFGIPAAQENDFVSAVHFAFDLQSSVTSLAREFDHSLQQPVSLRCGIHAGLVLMQPSVRMKSKYEITGQPLQIALTLASNAKPSEVLITQEGRRLTRNCFVTESRDDIALPGLSGSSKSFSLVSQSDPSTEGFLAPYTGREQEFNILRKCWERALSGEGQFVTLNGEAGVGKSRLFHEFKGSIKEEIRFLYGQCRPYGSSIPYAPFRELLVHALELNATSSPDEVIERVHRLDPLLQDFTPLYLHLLSLQSERFPFPKHLEGENLRFAILDALTAFVLVKKNFPVLLLLEDWHWADEASQNALRQILEMVTDQAVLALVTYRPDSSLDWTGVRHHQQIYLDPLESSSSRELMRSLIGSESVSEPLAQLIYDRTGGNPFFVEEICFTLRDEGKIKIEEGTATLVGSAKTLRLPETIQALLLSRLDRLDKKSRCVLQTASVIGREFTRTILQQVNKNEPNLATCLGSLKRLGLIQQLQVLPEATYKFRHALTQEVVYESMIAQEKKQIHQNVAEAIEEFYKDRLEEHFDLLAEHFSRAGIWRKAVEYGMRSSQKAASLGQFSEALHILKKTERWLASMTADEVHQQLEIDLMLQEERLCETLGIRDRQEQILRDLLAALNTQNDPNRQMEVYRRQGELLTLLARFDAAETALNQSLELSRSLKDSSGERNALRSIGFMRWHQGNNAESISYNEQALAIDRANGDPEAVATDLTNLGSVLRNQGDHAAALECLQEALKLYEQVNDPVKHAAALHLTGNVYRELGNSDEALHYMQAAMAVSTRYRLVIMQSFHLTSLANMCWQQGKMEECLELQKRAVEINRKSRYAEGLTNSLRMVGETLQSMNRPFDAVPYFEEAASLFARLKDHRNEAALWNRIAALYEDQNSWHDALETLEKVKKVHEITDDKKGVAEISERMAALSRKLGNIDRAIQHYREAVSTLEMIGEYPVVAANLNSIAILEWKVGKYSEALEDYQKALGIFQDHGDEVHSGLILNSIGLTLKSMRRYQEALNWLQRAVTVNRRTQQKKLEGHSLATIAEVYSELGEVEFAMQHYQEALKIKRQTGDVRGEAWMLYHLARLQSHFGQEQRIEEYLIEAEKIVADAGDDKLRDAWTELQRTFKTSGGDDHA